MFVTPCPLYCSETAPTTQLIGEWVVPRACSVEENIYTSLVMESKLSSHAGCTIATIPSQANAISNFKLMISVWNKWE
jgi:hypothetical protein